MQNQNTHSLALVSKHFVKELKAIGGDSGALLILVGAIIIYPLVYSMGYYNEVMTEVPVAVVDLDHTPMSRKYARMLNATQELNVAQKPYSLAEAETLFYENEVEGVVVLPSGFQSDLYKGLPTNVAVYADASYFLKYKTVYLAASVVNSYFSTGVGVTRYMYEGKSFKQAVLASDPLPVFRNVLYNPSSGYGSYVMPGLVLIVIQQTLLIGIGIMGGSFSESKLTPFLLPKDKRVKEIVPYLTGKLGAYMFLSLINIALAVVIIHDWFSYPDKGNMLYIFMLLLPYCIAVTALGVGVASWFKHRESSIVFMVFLSPIALFLSGMSWPVSAMPEWLVFFSKLMPSTTAVPAYLRLRTMGVDITAVKDEVLFLYAQATVYVGLTLAYFYYRVRADKWHWR